MSGPGWLRSGLGTRIAGATVLFGVVLAAIFAALLVTVTSRQHAVEVSRDTVKAVGDSFQTELLVLDSETGVRGYLLTREPRFLEPYDRAIKALPAALARLEHDVAGDPGQSARAHGIGGAVSEYLNGWARPTIDGAAITDSASNRRALEEGKRLVDALRRRFDTFNRVQGAKLTHENDHVDHLATLALVLGSGGIVVALLLMAACAAYAIRMVSPVRRVADAAMRRARGDLDSRVEVGGVAEVHALGVAFNQMADVLQRNAEDLESQNEELEAQQHELQSLFEQLSGEKSRVERLQEFSQAVSGQLELEALSDLVLGAMCDEGEADVGVLYVANAVVPVAERLATRGVRPALVAARIHEHEGIGGRALAERRPVTLDAGESGIPVAVLGGEQPARQQVAIPLLIGGERAGVAILGRVADRPFSGADLRTLRALSDQAAVAIARAREQRQTARSLRTVQAVLDATPDPIALIGPGGEIAFENRPMAELRAAAAGDGGAGLPADIDAAGDDPLREVRDEVHLDGGARALQRYAAPLLAEGDTYIGRILVLRDVSAEREAERMKDEFFAMVSHELRTPLTSIIGYLELVLEDEDAAADGPRLDPERRHFLSVVERNAQRLLRLVGDLLFVAQIKAGTLTITRGEVDLAQVVREAVDSAGPRAASAEVALHGETPDELPLTAADHDRLGQMIDNLLANAIKFTPAGGSVTARLRTDARGDAVLEVSDTGVGIAPADQERLFERFYRTADASARGVPGVGLGLTIVQAIVTAHGGSIAVESEQGRGTTFRVALPRRRREDGRLSVTAGPARAGGAPAD